MSLGSRIRYARELRGLDQTQLSERLGLPGGNSMISRWENNHNSPQAAHLMQLVEILRIDGHWLLTGEGDATVRLPDARVQLAQIRSYLRNVDL